MTQTPPSVIAVENPNYQQGMLTSLQAGLRAMRELPEPRVIEWLRRQSESESWTTAVTKAEILFGIAITPAGRRRTALETAADRILNSTFAGRVLAFEDEAARHYAQIAATRQTNIS